MTSTAKGKRNGSLRPWIRRVALTACAVVLLLTATASLMLAVLLMPVLRDPSPRFAARKGELVSAEVTRVETLGDTTLKEVLLVSTSGLAVELSVREPAGHAPPWPVVLLLGGQRTGRNAVRLIPETEGAVLAAISYPYTGDRSVRGLRGIWQLPKMQQAILDTTPALMLALDYLMELPGSNDERVELVGVSFGAFIVSVPGALDPRVDRVWLIHGAARPAAVLERGLEPHVANGPIRRALARLLAAVAGGRHLAPEKWVGRIAPRPVIAINARDDEALPRTCIDDLHLALGEPSEVQWMAGGHVKPRDEEVVAEITRRLMRRVLEDGAPAVAPSGE
jgi:hypothetical protein